MKNVTILLFLFIGFQSIAQKDSLQIGDKYWEDQLYMYISYNTILKQPKETSNSGFSYGITLGYIKDVPLNNQGNVSVGIGAGYNYESFNHGLRVLSSDEIIHDPDAGISSNEIKLHNIEFPIQFRWRTSDAVTYSFWRIYTGVKLTYNLSNKFSYQLNNQSFNYRNINIYNDFQTGLELSVGYGAFNLFVYYGLTPMYKNVVIDTEKVNSKIAKFGLIFYLL
ncbi:porin family protein [Tenacibaculum sp. IB213877]|uniref:porin family protein n=1 Tax=Tenacibaculum sp. IB213877 TaxID=3097351 RepID=UPI002A59B652|nr:porin family protein [Tenacibaculum sp. IB213877]MDY0780930.1 porin family protein [Tenacibaculum sp. IB213877]